ncbi:MAG TPA: class I tRNA ligase family protein, partial [Candidatus Limnocylindrales bacterium]|nr:class I tRNA ligase family protein [Candidatus Limnocylindrales bacterium]
ARMMMLGLHLTDREPFHTIYLSGLIRDAQGLKMSKTKGNVVDPLAVIEESGADALRFAVIHGSTPGLDQRFADQKLESGRTFANKLWNATRFVIGARPAGIAAGLDRRELDPAHLGPAERWIRSRVAATIAAVDRAIADDAFGVVTRSLYDGIWSDFCDWGLELAKVRLSDDALPAETREATWWTLVEALDTYLRLLHPVMPFVTEELWAALPHRSTDPGLLIVARWPAPAGRDEIVESQVGSLIELVRGIRNARAEARIEPGLWLPVDVTMGQRIGDTFEALRPAIARLARARPLERHLTPEALHAATRGAATGLTVIAGEIEAVVGRPTGATDAAAGASAAADRARLEKELVEAEGHLAAARARLANDAFIANAPPPVVAGARASEAELADQVARLRASLDG